jgi:L-ribulose-5-phosphate 3-epimerase
VKTSISISPVQTAAPLAESAALAAAAGFDAVELTVAEDGPLSYNTPEADCRRLADCIRQAGLTVSALVAGGSMASALFSPDPAARRAASQQIVAAMHWARWFGTDAVVLPMRSRVDATSPGSHGDYQTVYSHALDAILALRFEAEQRAVHVVCGTGWNRFLASPFEVRRFVDTISSPWIGASLDITAPLPGGGPEDWLALLGHRIIRVYLGDVAPGPPVAEQGAPSAVEGAHRLIVTEALRRSRYDAPLTYRGRAELGQARAALDRLLS